MTTGAPRHDNVARPGAALRLSRRAAIGAALTAGLAGMANAGDAAARRLTLYSPAPAGNPMHALNLRFGASLNGIADIAAVDVNAVPLPDSINRISDMPVAERAWHLPIVTTVDFLPARAGGGPQHHRYDRASPDLYLVTPLYDVGLGIQVVDPGIDHPDKLRGKRIAVPPRPSAVRLLTEALLGDGWDVLRDVELIALSAPDAARALASGAVDATSWNLIVPAAGGHAPILPLQDGRYLPVDAAALTRIHAANPFRSALTRLRPNLPDLLSFAQGLAAWRETPAPVVRSLAKAGGMMGWPQITGDAMHPALCGDNQCT